MKYTKQRTIRNDKLRKYYISTFAPHAGKKRAVTTISDPDAFQRPSNASQSTESLVIEVVGADVLPVRSKGAAKPISVDRFAALISDALPASFGGVVA